METGGIRRRFLWLGGDYTRRKQVGPVVGVGSITQKWGRAAGGFHVEDLLHGTQIGRVRKIDRAGVGQAVQVWMCQTVVGRRVGDVLAKVYELRQIVDRCSRSHRVTHSTNKPARER
jgi:hypothetical protein